MLPAAVTKMHGAYNDFVILDERADPIDDLAAFARALCDRRGGVGADGLIAVGPSHSGHVRMRIFNADGSRAEVCGNGLRCLARFLSEAGEGDRFDVETDTGLVRAEVLEKGEIYRVRLELGRPRFERRALPFPSAAFVSIGNPHVVIFESELDAIDLPAVARALQLQFEGGTNVHVAVVEQPGALRVRHYERGAGLTYACGTGAVACAAAAISLGLLQSPVRVRVPGGDLDVSWDGEHAAYLTGPAVRVFDARLAAIHAAP